MKWTADQQSVIDTRDCDLLVSAAAGSGKTAVLVERIITKITDAKNPMDIDALLVVTFTNAAAAQMREKITKALYQCLEENPADEHLVRQLALIHNASITTIDSFCLQVVREHFQVLGLDPGFMIADSAELAALSADALEQVLEEAYDKADPAFLDFVDCYGADKSDVQIEAYITGIAKKAASYPDPYQWILDARTALDMTQIEQVEEKHWYQSYVEYLYQMLSGCRMDMEYVKRVCGKDPGLEDFSVTCDMDMQMLDGVLEKVHTGSFAAMQAACSNREWARAKAIKKKDVSEELAEFVKDSRKQYKQAVDKLCAMFENLSPDTLLLEMDNIRQHMQVLLKITEAYMRCLDEKKIAEGMLDFSDVEHFALRILTDENGPTAVAKEYQRQYQEIMIDEYQDSNFLQEDILSAISGKDDAHYNMFMVGDVKQSIYRFRMARPDLFMHKYAAYQSIGDQRKIDLKCNFRSRAVVLEAVNYMFYQLMSADFGGITYDASAALVPGMTFPPAQGCTVSDSTELMIYDETAYGNAYDDSEAMEPDKLEAEACMIAQRILELTGQRGEHPLYVLDEDGEHYRVAEYRDIAILFRSVSVTAPVFLKVFARYGIPVVSELASGLMHTQEVQTLLACLSIIHNPYQDIDLVTVLHSPMFGFTDERLAQIRVKAEQRQGRMSYFYEAFFSLSDVEEDIAAFMKRLAQWQEQSRYMDTASLMWAVLKDTGYLLYLQALDGADRRLANVHYLISCAMRFGENGRYSVYEFLQYISKMKDAELDMGEAGIHGEHDNIVRIMSMHKSKGLEFPIVFAACLSRQFNLNDAKDDIIIHGDDFLAAHYVDAKRRIRKKTWMHHVFAENMKTEDIAEEFRVLYVAMTRAKEKLILTGCLKDFSQTVDGYGRIAGLSDRLLPFGYRRKALSYMDWILMSLIRNPQFYEAVTKTLPDQSRMNRCEYILDVGTQPADFQLSVQLVRQEDLKLKEMAHMGQHLLDTGEYLVLQQKATDAVKQNDDVKQKLEAFCSRMDFQYPYADIADSKAKYSVSELKAAGGSMEQHDMSGQKEHTVPAFMQQTKTVTGASRGTLIHRIMQLLDFTVCGDQTQILEQISYQIGQKMLPETTLDSVNIKEIAAFFKSEPAQEMTEAYRKNLLYKERQFTMLVPLAFVMEEEHTTVSAHAEAEQVLVQGIIDVYYEREDGTLVVVDYKTDRNALPMEQYERQLRYYADALERLTHKKVSACYIYWFTKDQMIEVAR